MKRRKRTPERQRNIWIGITGAAILSAYMIGTYLLWSNRSPIEWKQHSNEADGQPDNTHIYFENQQR